MTYSELLTNLQSLLNRDDLTAQLPFWIEQAESAFAAPVDYGGLRHWRMERKATASVSDRYLAFPAGYIETIRLYNRDTDAPMEYLSRQVMQEARARTNDVAGDPTCYRHQGDGFALYPTPNETSSIELEYYARPPRLNKDDYATGTTVTSNWISENYPDIYLYGAAIHSAPYLHDDQRISTWSTMLATAVKRLNAEGRQQEVSGSSHRLRIRGMP